MALRHRCARVAELRRRARHQAHPLANNLASFAIHADDVQRCRRFYERCFSGNSSPGPAGLLSDPHGDADKPGVQGLLHKRQQPRGDGGPNCFECTIAVGDLDAVTAAIAATAAPS